MWSQCSQYWCPSSWLCPLWAWSTFGCEDMNGAIMDLTHGMHILKLLLSRYLLNNLQLFRNVKVSVGTSQDVSPTLLVHLNFHEPLLTVILGFHHHKFKSSKFITYFSHSIWRNELLMCNFEFVTRLYGCFMLRVA